MMNATELHPPALAQGNESPPRYAPRKATPPAYGPARPIKGAGSGHPPGGGRISLITQGLARRLAIALLLAAVLWAVVLWALG